MAIIDCVILLPTEAGNTGQFADYSQLTRTDGTVVIRPRTTISDPESANNHARVLDTGQLKVTDGPSNDKDPKEKFFVLGKLILIELRRFIKLYEEECLNNAPNSSEIEIPELFEYEQE